MAGSWSGLEAMAIIISKSIAGYRRRRRAAATAAGDSACHLRTPRYRAAVAVLTALAMTVVLLIIGWAAYGATIPGHTAPAFVLDIITGAVVFCCLGFTAATVIRNVDAVQPGIWATVLPLCFISGIFIPVSVLPAWPARIGYVFPVHPLAAALLEAYKPHTTGSGLNWGYLAILAACGLAGLIIAARRFSWLPHRG